MQLDFNTFQHVLITHKCTVHSKRLKAPARTHSYSSRHSKPRADHRHDNVSKPNPCVIASVIALRRELLVRSYLRKQPHIH